MEAITRTPLDALDRAERDAGAVGELDLRSRGWR